MVLIDEILSRLVNYALRKELIAPCEKAWAVNALLEVLKLDTFQDPEKTWEEEPLAPLLEELLNDAFQRGVLSENTVLHRDLLDTELMGRLTPRPAQVIGQFEERYARSPQEATDWYYTFCQDTNYIRRDRIAKDVKWVTATAYGGLDITINLSKPEKDPKAIAAALRTSGKSYPHCQLCRENEGYAGRLDAPARQNHRPIPLRLEGQDWFFQYSPYVYYQEHCIVFNAQHVPMKVDGGTFRRLLDFETRFPHYFIGSNADLPIVGGSILTHDHFQGGRYCFPMERAAVDRQVTIPGYEEISAGVVHWPMSVLRLTGSDPERLAALSEQVLDAWRGYSDPLVGVFAWTEGEPHNTITPIARRRGTAFEMDLVLRNNRTTEEYPLGIFHPHQELHHIKKENIGLIEVMGMAILPARLKEELTCLANLLVSGGDLLADERTAKHAPWAQELLERYHFTSENVQTILQNEVGQVFAQVLFHAGVFKPTPEGQAAFDRFLNTLSGAR